MGFYQFKRRQHFNCSIDELWDFISNPHNLKRITPEHMGFDIISNDGSEKMYQGMIIAYKVAPLMNIKTTWVTEITHVEDKKYFVDEQRVGPYKLWHHQHILETNTDGTSMHDIVSYQPPMGFLGNVANTLLIKNKLKSIFDYREKVLMGLF